MAKVSKILIYPIKSLDGFLRDRATVIPPGTLKQATLPQWAATKRFNHYYRLSINTRIPASQIVEPLPSIQRI